jgi:hypothetical protein
MAAPVKAAFRDDWTWSIMIKLPPAMGLATNQPFGRGLTLIGSDRGYLDVASSLP